MKSRILFLFLLLFTLAAPAQELLELEWADAKKEVALDLSNLNQDVVLKARIRNVSGLTLQLRWLREAHIQPDAWLTQVCDNNFCYLPSVSTNYDKANNFNIPLLLLPGEALNLVFHVYPSGKAGVGYFTVPLALTERPDEPIVRAEFQVKIEDAGTAQENGRAKLRIFPNPATLYFELSDESRLVNQVVLYNAIGKAVRTYQAANGIRYDISDLPAGLYLASLRDSRNEVVKTLRLVKRSPRA